LAVTTLKTRFPVEASLIFALISLLAFSAGVGAGALATPSTSASATPEDTLPPDKQAELDRDLQAMASAEAANESLGITKANDPGRPLPGPTDGAILEPHFVAGAGMVIESTYPAPGMDAPVTNVWFEDRGGSDFTTVFAGRDAKDVSQGLVLVTHGMPGDVQRFDAPGAHGALEVVGAVGELLTLRAADGATQYFDAASLSFR
jgi:hypothetical protein